MSSYPELLSPHPDLYERCRLGFEYKSPISVYILCERLLKLKSYKYKEILLDDGFVAKRKINFYKFKTEIYNSILRLLYNYSQFTTIQGIYKGVYIRVDVNLYADTFVIIFDRTSKKSIIADFINSLF